MKRHWDEWAEVYVTVFVLVAMVSVMMFALADDQTTCMRGHWEQGAPAYVHSGNMLLPIPQTYFVCDERIQKP